MDGIVNIYKEKGYTSHDVVAKLRGILRTKKIGHTGTLDPDAEGVLPVCIGKATKLCDMLTDKNKAYCTVLLLGKRTDTQDIAGTILEEKELPDNLTKEYLQEVIHSFKGEYMQTPPMYSAVKVRGKKLYELARQGIEIERQPRKVQILDIRIEEIILPRIKMTVECSKGTYIRTLCQDIGEKVGTGGCMEELLRIRSGAFSLEESIKISEVEDHMKSGTIDQILKPIDSVFKDYPSAVVKKEANRLLYNGNKLPVLYFTEQRRFSQGDKFRIYDEEENFIGIYEYSEEERLCIPVKMFFTGK